MLKSAAVRSCLRQRGYSAIELLIVLAIAGVIAAVSVPASIGMVDELRLSGDAHAVSNAIALARMGAAANFTRGRLFVDRAANQFRIEWWNKATNAWVPSGDVSPLGSNDAFTTGAIGTPPPNSQDVMAQPPACLNAAGAAIANTSCVLFNSRGLPVDGAGAPSATLVLYLSGPSAVYAVVVSATSQLAVWRVSPGGGTWTQK